MNGWDLFTWAMVLLLGGGAIVIFAFYLRDVRAVLRGRGDRPPRNP
jgi:hypothetical protein